MDDDKKVVEGEEVVETPAEQAEMPAEAAPTE